MSKSILCVIDNSEELRVAVRFAALLARRQQADVAFLYTLEPATFQHWQAVEQLMRAESRAEAETAMQKWAIMVEGLTGNRPVSYIREGKAREELLKLLEEEPEIVHLVLATSPTPDNPGPLVSALTSGKLLGKLRVPLTILSGRLSDAEVDALS
jgi:nucleotide-binding universal stress UspA family protein